MSKVAGNVARNGRRHYLEDRRVNLGVLLNE